MTAGRERNSNLEMMQPILERLAQYLIQKDPEDLGQTRIILPNRRSGLFLQRHLARHIRRIGWVPGIYSISDFINELSQLAPSEPTELFFTLYRLYQELVEQPDPMDEFYMWGDMMLRDFDELDKYLVDADLLFRNIMDLKELDEPLAGLEPAQVEFIRQFWTSFHKGDYTPEKEKFIGGWILLPDLYRKLKKTLSGRGEGYQGMQYREIVERIGTGALEWKWEGPVVVAGFNALNACESRIFAWLQNHGAEFFWDFDHQYTDPEGKEAGRFLKENIRRFPPPVQLEEFRGLEEKKECRIFELPTDVLQAKIVHRILSGEDPDTWRECTNTALILCDEELLVPVMMSLPEEIREVNVTMGYPMKHSPVYSFIESLLRMQHNIRISSGGNELFYHKDVISILLHPYFRKLTDRLSETLTRSILQDNLVMVDRSLFKGELELTIFKHIGDDSGILEYLKAIFIQMLEALAGRGGGMPDTLDREFILQLLTHLNKLERMVSSYPSIPGSMLERLLRKMLAGLRIPFEGEPLAGLQIMGILETRMLDFKHVILISMNEEIMPALHSSYSNIPYTLRLAFGMPSREDMDAIYAYYFYRLIQRAERVDLLYNSGSEGMRTGEMSRYLYQLKYDRPVEFIRPGMEVRAREVPPVKIDHSPKVDQVLSRYLEGAEEGRYLSPSAVNTYVDCSLKFYLRYIAGIGEPDEVREEIDAPGFGTVIHDTLKELYSTIAARNSKRVTRNELNDLLSSDQPETVLKREFMKQHFKGRKGQKLEGRNIIILHVMLRYLEKILHTDLTIAPFEFVSAEEEYTRPLELEAGDRQLEVRLGGKIDRIDRLEGAYRVIDYKTGQAVQTFSTLESLFERNLGNRNSAAMQTLFYAWLVGTEFTGETVMPGLYTMKGLFEEDFDPALRRTGHKQAERIGSFSEVEEPFVDLLKGVLRNLFDPAVPFDQRKQDRKCGYCDFASICQRKEI
jgi:hypothetical protein